MGLETPVDQFGRLDDEFRDPFEAKAPPPPPKRRGCVFYGCLGLAVGLVLLAVGLTAFTFFGGRYLIENFTATEPIELPEVELPPEEQQSLNRRVEQFERVAEDVDDGPAEIRLTARELNALIGSNPDVRGRLYLEIKDGRLIGQVSVPLSLLEIDFEPLAGRYLNGRARFALETRDGALLVGVEHIEVNGRSLPEPLVSRLRESEFVIEVGKDLNPEPEPDGERRPSAFIEEVRIVDDALLLRARASRRPEPPAP